MKKSLFFVASIACAQPTSTQVDWITQIKNPPVMDSRTYNWPQKSPGGSLPSGACSFTLSPMPLGLTTGGQVYISGGTGAAETLTITNVASTTVSGVCANAHSGAWNVKPIANGLQEAICALPAAGGTVIVHSNITLLANVNACGKTSVIVQRQPGVTISGNFLILEGSPSSPSATKIELYISPPVWNSSRTEIVHGYRMAMGNFPPTAEFGSNTNGGMNGFISMINIPPGATANAGASAVAGYIRTASAPANAVGLFGGANAYNDYGAAGWGINSVTQNCDGENTCQGNVGNSGVNLWGYEADVNLIPPPGGGIPLGNVRGVAITGGSRTQPTGDAYALIISPMGIFDGVGWKYGLFFEDGTATISGITVGATSSGNDVDSMPITLVSRTAGGTTAGAQIISDKLGDLQLKAGLPGGYVVLNDNDLNAALVVSPSTPMGSPTVSIVNALIMSNKVFTALGAVPAAGTSVYCTNCTTATPCAGGGTGHLAVSNGTAWTCQ
jgi:hypothetical protein